MLIRKLVVAATLVAAGAAAHAGTVSTAAGGKDVFNLTDSVFGTKMFTGLAVNATPVAAPVISEAAIDKLPVTAAIDTLPVTAAIDTLPVTAAIDTAAIVTLPAASGNFDGGTSASVIVPMPDVAPALVTPMADVPEPASMALMLAGIMGVGALRRRKQQR